MVNIRLGLKHYRHLDHGINYNPVVSCVLGAVLRNHDGNSVGCLTPVTIKCPVSVIIC